MAILRSSSGGFNIAANRDLSTCPVFPVGDIVDVKRMHLDGASSSSLTDSLPLLATEVLDLSTNSSRSRVGF